MKRMPLSNILNFHQELKDMDPTSIYERKAISTDLTSEQDGTLVVIASTPTVDYDGDVVDPLGIRTDKYNNVILWNHDLNSPPIGTCVENKIDESGMIAKFQLSNTYEFAVDLMNLCREGILRGVSIGYIPIKTLKAGTSEFYKYATEKGWSIEGVKRIISEVELIEISLCAVGCNSDALIVAAKSFTSNLTSKALKIETGIEVGAEEEPISETSMPLATEETESVEVKDCVKEYIKEIVPIKFTDLGCAKSRIKDFSQKVQRTLKGLPI